jgi:hypothetical protein
MKHKLLLLLVCIFFINVGFSQDINPYLQAARPTSIYINWKTDNGTNPKVFYGTDETNLNMMASGTTENLEPKDTDYNTPYHYHTVKLLELSANTGYYYQAISGTSDISTIHYFKTPPNLGDDTGILRFIALGDHQIINYNGTPYMKYNELVLAAKEKAEELYGRPLAENFNLIMNDGDQVDLGKLQHYEEIHFNKTSPITADLPLITAVGNHETYGSTYQNGAMQAYYDHFVLNDDWTYGGINSGTERYYAYQMANVLFMVLDTELNSTAQENWLQSVMEFVKTDADVDWVISIAHRPYEAEQYSNDYSSWFTDKALPKLEFTEKYVLHIAGHHHVYARGQFKNHNGYHIISGGTAWPQYWGDSSNEDDRDETQGTWSNFAYQLIEINNQTKEMNVKSYTIGSLTTTKDNELLDEFTFKKNIEIPNTPTITNTIESVVNLPLTLNSSPYATATSEVFNSTEFQIASTSDFSIIAIDTYRHVDNYFGPTESATDETKNIGFGDGILEYTIPDFFLSNGSYYARVRHRDANLGWSAWSESIEFTVEGSTDGEPLIYLDKTSYTSSEDFEITFINGPGGNLDWIGIYENGDIPGTNGSNTYQYVNGESSGLKTFNLSTSGIYYAAFFINDSFEEITDRVYFWVGEIPTIASDQVVYNDGDDAIITYTNHPNNPTDWIGLYKVGDEIGENNETMRLNIDTTADNVTFAGLPNAYYYAVYHVQDSYLIAGEPINFQIGDEIAIISTAKTSFAQGEPITIDFTGGTGIEKDYIGVIIDDGTPAGTENLWTYKYFGGLTAGSTTITRTDYVQGGANQLPVVGNYYLAMFTDDSYTQVSNAIPITITDDTTIYMDLDIVNANVSFDIHFLNAPGNATDWIGIYAEGDTPGDPSSQTYEYIDAEINGIKTFTLPNGGKCFASLFVDDSYTEASERVLFTVRDSPVLTLTQSVYASDEVVIVNLAEGGLPDVSDWVGIYAQADEPSASTVVRKISVTTELQSFDFEMLEDGLYYAVYHSENTYTEVGERVAFQVGRRVVSLSVALPDYYIGDTVEFTLKNATGDDEDYIAVYTADSEPQTDDFVTFLNLITLTSGSVTLDGTAGNVGTENVLPQTSGLYFAVVIDPTTGEEISNRVSFIINPQPTATLELTEILVGDPIVVNYANGPGSTIDWLGVYAENETPGGGPLSTTWEYVDSTNLSTGTITLDGISTPGNYFLSFFVNDGYTEISDRFYFEVVADVLGLPEVVSKDGKIIIYPNPSIGIAYIKAQSEIEKVEVFDIEGKIVQIQGAVNQTTTTLFLRSMSKGMYLVKVHLDGTSQTLKLILR